MNGLLSQQIKTRMEANSLSIPRLEKKAGLKIHAVRNILTGKSKKPSAETLLLISKALGCSITDLLEKRSVDTTPIAPPGQKSNKNQKELPWNHTLFAQSVASVQAIFLEKNYIPNFEEALFFVREVYLYGISKKKPYVDAQFTEWLIDRNLSSAG